MKRFTRSSNFTRFLAALIGAVLFGLLLTQASTLYAFPVSPLPEGNLITNPWFRSFSDPTDSALDGWTDAAGQNAYWSSSQKESNPSPDVVISGVCGREPVYCGTAGRLSTSPGQSGGVAQVGVDAYLYQVVEADENNLKLKFFMHWVSHIVDPAEVTIYGGDSPLGPWTPVWTPFDIVQGTLETPSNGGGQEELWTQTDMLETTIADGFPFYKVEIHANLPAEDRTGFKITGVYFTTEAISGGELPTPAGTLESTPEATATSTTVATVTSTPVASATSTPAATVTATAVLSPTPDSSDGNEPVEQGEGLQLSATVLSASQLELTWVDPFPNERGYEVERSVNGGSSWSRIARLPSDATGFVDGGLAPDTTYFYRLSTSVIDGARTSNVVSPTTHDPLEPTPVPTVEPTDVPTIEPTTEPTVEPTPVPTVEPTAAPTVEPTVEPTTVPTVEPTPVPTTEPTVEPTIEPTATATTMPAPTAIPEPVDGMLLTATALSSSQVELTWTDALPNERGYAVERSLDGVSGWTKITRLPSDATGFVDGGLAPGATYFYRLSTSATDGSRISNVAWATTQ